MSAIAGRAARRLRERYEALVAHAEQELELAGAGDLAGLAALSEEWPELIEGLPARPAREHAPLLQRARLLHERTRVELLRLREGVLAGATTASRARRTAAGYGGQGGAARTLDRSA